MTKVVNLYKESYDVYIGRPGKQQDGYFGNPIVVGKSCPVCESIHMDGGSTLPCYEQYLEARLESDSRFKEKVKNLHNKTLGCFCKPKPCHGDVLIKYITLLNEQNETAIY